MKKQKSIVQEEKNEETEVQELNKHILKNQNGKAKYWCAVLYPENMIDNWENDIGEILQYPYAYCIHDSDLNDDGTERKKHVHLIVAFTNTTTYKNAYSIISGLSAPNKMACNKIERAINVRYAYDYLIHDTDNCRKQKKHEYDKSERITGNNFDIGAFEQLSITDKNKMLKELCNVILELKFTNFVDFYTYFLNNFSDEYFEILKSNTSLLKEMIRGNYLKRQDIIEQSKIDSNRRH